MLEYAISDEIRVIQIKKHYLCHVKIEENSFNMKNKSFIITVLVVFILVFLSTASVRTNHSEGYKPGKIAPKIEIAADNQTIDFTAQPHHYTLVNFWAAYDAVSRVLNIQLWHEIKELDSTRITLYSISMDEIASVFSETVKIDKLENTNQLHDSQGLKSPLFAQYGLKRGFNNFLIDDRGVIVATNVKPKQLAEMVSKPAR
ncbi:MAG: peroxiredoxin family protein, partial [Tannerella sp.]|jgi:hypothetical protein|nr:peroxiredoxin family protein [Tannerella sp.]